MGMDYNEMYTEKEFLIDLNELGIKKLIKMNIYKIQHSPGEEMKFDIIMDVNDKHSEKTMLPNKNNRYQRYPSFKTKISDRGN
jgi:hypothetical protein